MEALEAMMEVSSEASSTVSWTDQFASVLFTSSSSQTAAALVDETDLYNASGFDAAPTTRLPVAVPAKLYCGEGLEVFRQTYLLMHGYISLMVCLFGALANTLNIVVLTRMDQRISPTNAILTGLAVADNLVMIEYIPFALHMYILRERPIYERFNYPWAVYVLVHAHVTQVFHTISIWLTLLLAIWRYISVAHPLRSRDWCTLDRALLAILLAYVISPAVCIPLYLTFTIQEQPYRPANGSEFTLYLLGTSELAKANSSLLENVNFWTYSVVVKLIPCVALTILSFQLIRALVSAKERRNNLKTKNSNIARDRPSTCAKNPSGKESANGEKHDRTTRMLLAVLFLFLVTEFPQGILALLSGILGDEFFNNCYRHLGELMDILALFNGAINFILYCAMSRQFRQTFNRIFRPRVLDKWNASNHAPLAGANNQPLRTTLVNEAAPHTPGPCPV